MTSYKDEILADSVPRYNITKSDGTIVAENVSIDLATNVTQEGTALNKAFFDSIKKDIDTSLYAYDMSVLPQTTSNSNINGYTFPSTLDIEDNKVFTLVPQNSTTNFATNIVPNVSNGLGEADLPNNLGKCYKVDETTKKLYTNVYAYCYDSEDETATYNSNFNDDAKYLFDSNVSTDGAGALGIDKCVVALEFPSLLCVQKIEIYYKCINVYTFNLELYATNDFTSADISTWTKLGSYELSHSYDTTFTNTFEVSNNNQYKYYAFHIPASKSKYLFYNYGEIYTLKILSGNYSEYNPDKTQSQINGQDVLSATNGNQVKFELEFPYRVIRKNSKWYLVNS